MSIQQKEYHQRLYQSLAQANARRVFELEKQKALHDEILTHYQNQIYHNQMDSRRLRFRNFVAQKLQEERILRGVDQQQFHQEYLRRIQHLKIQREKLNAFPHRMSFQELQCYRNIQLNDHRLLCDKEKLPLEYQQNQGESASKWQNTGSGEKKFGFIRGLHNEPTEHRNFPNKFGYETTKPKQQLYDHKPTYNSVLANNIHKRWVPYDQQDTYQQKMKEKEFEKKEEGLKEIQKWHNQIKQRKIKANQATKTPIFENSRIKAFEKELSQKYLSAKLQGKTNDENSRSSIITTKKPMLIEDNYVVEDEKRTPEAGCKAGWATKAESSNKKSSKKTKKRQAYQSLNNKSINQGLKPKYYFQQKPQKQNKIQQNGALTKIKNRLTLSTVVYEDSEHRNILHQKTHLANKFATECKMRKDIINKICNNKVVTDKYKNVSLACVNLE